MISERIANAVFPAGKGIPRVILFLAAAGVLLSCGSSIHTAQDFKPNKAPVVESFSVSYIGNDASYNPETLYSGMPFLVSVTAHDPEGGKLSYSITSDQGTFGSRKSTDDGTSCRFYVGTVSENDAVRVNLVVTDEKKASYTQSIDVGSGKAGPSITLMPPTKAVLPADGDTYLTVSSGCKGVFHAYRDNSISDGNSAVLGTTDLTDYTTAGEAVKVVIKGPSSHVNGGVPLVNNVKNKIWVVFRDDNEQTDTAFCEMYVEGTAPEIISVYPEDSGEGVSVTPSVSVQFSKSMDPTTLTAANVSLKDSSGTAVSGTLSYNSADDIETFTPSVSLSYAAVYTLSVSASVSDSVGNKMAIAESYSFTTAAKDTIPTVEFSPPPGTYDGTRSVMLSNDDSSATIVYTTDGTLPVVTKNGSGVYSITNGSAYSGTISASGNMTIRALAFRDGYSPSNSVSAVYKIRPEPPVFSFTKKTNCSTGAGTLSISTPTNGARIYYTTDGTDPSGTAGNLLGSLETITVNENMTVRAVAKLAGLTDSDETRETYPVSTTVPEFSVTSGTTVQSGTTLYLSCESGAVIYYMSTADGSEPSDPSASGVAPSVYFTGITLDGSSTGRVTYKIRAYAKKTGMNDSSESGTVTVYVDNGKVSSVVMTPSGGLYYEDKTVTMNTATDGAQIFYTTNGSDPGVILNGDGTFTSGSGTELCSSGTVISVAGNETMMTIKAVAVKYGMTDSDITSAAYTIITRADMPTFSPSPGTFTVDQNITISADDDAEIYFTTNGSAPEVTKNSDGSLTVANGTLYTSPLSIAANGSTMSGVTVLTLNAIAVKSGPANSDVASGIFSLIANISGVALWSRPLTSGTSSSAFNGVASDDSGCSYASGYLTGQGAYDFGNGVVLASDSTRSSSINALIVKYNSSGECIWTKTVTGAGIPSGFYSIKVKSGYVYMVGYVEGSGTLNFGKDSGGNDVILNSSCPYQNILIVKYDTSGNCVWAKTVSSAAGYSIFRGVYVDSSGNVYAGGYLQGTGLYDFGDAGTVETNAARFSGSNILLVKYSSEGICRWAKTVSSSAAGTSINDLVLDGSNIYTAVSVSSNSQVNLGFSSSGVHTAVTCCNGSQNAAIVRYDTSGNCQQAKTLSTAIYQHNFTGIASDASHGIYVAGYVVNSTDATYDFGNNITLGPGVTRLIAVSIKYDSALNCQWVRSVSDSTVNSDCVAQKITADNSGNVYTAGYLCSNVSYNFGNNISISGKYSGWNAFAVKYSTEGICQWATTLSSASNSTAYNCVNFNSTSNSLLAAGFFQNNGSFNYGGKSQSFSGKGYSSGNNAVVVRYAP
jgi:hypothetical protein